ncbi:MAG: DNA ligase D [Sphingomonadaceae bacterium]|nr:DNA ligase D [Sphingomonadaceae bacterium]
MARSLQRYHEKRDFQKTPEPPGEAESSGRNLFIVQRHEATRLHWDFRLELDGVLVSWAVTRGPSADPNDKRLAVRTEDHPLSYATFEGTIPKGEYGGGTVMLWDRGTWEPLPGKDPAKTLEEGHLHFTLHGERMRGEWILIRLKPRLKERQESWLLRKVADEHAGGDLAAEFQTSVTTGRTTEEIAAEAAARPSAGDADATPPSPGVADAPPPSAARGNRDDGADANATPPAKRDRKRPPGGQDEDGESAAPPPFRAPMLATLADTPPTGTGWLHEVKFDGYRCLVAIGGGAVQAWTRNENRFEPPNFKAVAAELARLPGPALLDGEICALDHHGRPQFSLLKGSLKEGSAALDLFVFDALSIAGETLTGLPLVDRKERLRAYLKDAKPPVHFTDHVRGEGERVLHALCEGGYEGIVSKRCDSKYEVGRRGKAWLKIKCGRRQEFVIGGWTHSDKGRGFASLLLGYYDHDRLIYTGRVGTGFTVADIRSLMERMKPLHVDTPAFAELPREARRGATFIRPELVGEVAYTEFTPDGHLRHPSFLGLREDKPARQVVLETPMHVDRARPARASADADLPPSRKRDGEGGTTKRAARGKGTPAPPHIPVVITHPERVIYPEGGITKGRLADYYWAVADLMLAEIAGRPLSLVRCPQGRAKQCFFQKHDNGMFPDSVRKVLVAEKGPDRQPYLYIDSAEGLMALVQMGVIEFHIWGSHTPDFERPDRVVFDLDPDEGLAFADVAQAALDLRDRLKQMGLVSWPMLTGGKGIHVVVPCAPASDWESVKAWAGSFAKALAAEEPARFVANMAKKARVGRIFVDYLRNGRGATAIAPYSARAREGAPVAAPVGWQELGRMKPGRYSVGDAAELIERAERLKGWARSDQPLPIAR